MLTPRMISARDGPSHRVFSMEPRFAAYVFNGHSMSLATLAAPCSGSGAIGGGALDGLSSSSHHLSAPATGSRDVQVVHDRGLGLIQAAGLLDFVPGASRLKSKAIGFCQVDCQGSAPRCLAGCRGFRCAMRRAACFKTVCQSGTESSGGFALGAWATWRSPSRTRPERWPRLRCRRGRYFKACTWA